MQAHSGRRYLGRGFLSPRLEVSLFQDLVLTCRGDELVQLVQGLGIARISLIYSTEIRVSIEGMADSDLVGDSYSTDNGFDGNVTCVRRHCLCKWLPLTKGDRTYTIPSTTCDMRYIRQMYLYR